MITKRERILSIIMIMIQLIMTLFIFFLTEDAFPHHVFHFKQYIFFSLEIILIWGFFLYKLKLGTIFRNKSALSLVRGYFVTISFGCTVIFVEIVLFSLVIDVFFSFRFLLTFAVVDFIILLSFKILFYSLMLHLRRHGHNIRKIILIADSTSLSFINNFINARDWGYDVVAIITQEEHFNCDDCKIPVYYNSNMTDINALIQGQPVDDVFYCLSINNKSYDIEALIKYTNEIGIDFHILEEQNSINHSSLNDLEPDLDKDYNFKTISKAPHHYISIKFKDSLDIIFSIVALIIAAPFLAIFALIIKIEDGGSVFFKQERIGMNGRRFMLYKFRTMVPNAETLLDDLQKENEADGPVFKIENDPRITRIGKFLRKTSIDEFPQFYNVIKGDMSIVGPRPPLLLEVQQYKRPQLRRLSMKPGITCIWQVKGRHDVTFEEWMRMDLDYIDHWSLWLDFKLMIATVGVILNAKGQ